MRRLIEAHRADGGAFVAASPASRGGALRAHGLALFAGLGEPNSYRAAVGRARRVERGTGGKPVKLGP
ncbi:MAG TPA: hypothetical protein VLW05_08960 [Gaiellaceae bacterium]|nr:hypothetical protein [Gaiellaceae bacterium]